MILPLPPDWDSRLRRASAACKPALARLRPHALPALALAALALLANGSLAAPRPVVPRHPGSLEPAPAAAAPPLEGATLPAPTPTPFQPLPPEPWPAASLDAAAAALPTASAPGPSPLPAPTSPDLWDFHGIRFEPGSGRVRLRLFPTAALNRGRPLRVSFRPASECRFGDGRACAAAFEMPGGGRVIFLTAHSGVGGEAEPLRRLLEGAGWDAAAFPMREVRQRMRTLAGAAASLAQGDLEAGDLSLWALGRVPASHVERYYSLPVSEALAFAAEIDPDLAAAALPGRTLLVLETCGWKMPGEPWAKGVTPTTGSVYLFVFQ